MGYFFNRLDHLFMNNGAKTFRIGLNAGDQFFADANHFTPFKGRIEEWEGFIAGFFDKHDINMIFVFGDCRFYQSVAIKVAHQLGVEVFVFEEGYVRPDFITLEKNGVNDNTSLPRERFFYDAFTYSDDTECDAKRIKHIGSTYGSMALQAIIYYIIADIMRFSYPHYQHHRPLSFLLEGFYGIRNFLRKNYYQFLERNALEEYKSSLDKNFYFVALQTFEDFQITHHSDYESVETFIDEVLLSFCQNAPKDKFLVIKHHPMDRGKKNYKPMIEARAKELGCIERVRIVYDLHLPTLLKHAIGTITINSTVGISSLLHHTPTICLGRSFYDIEGLTCKGMSLEDFWTKHTEVDKDLFEKFRCYLIQTTQVNGTFYKKF